MQPKFLRPLKGNPNGITINQHIHSAHCIKKFYIDGEVEYCSVKSGKIEKVRANDFKFCVKRAWSQRAEHIIMERDIEKGYFSIIDNIDDLNFDDNAISRYYLLCMARFLAKYKERVDVEMKGVIPPSLSKEQMEALEVNGYIYCDPNGKIPFHIFEGMSIQVSIDRAMTNEFGKLKWGLVTAKYGSFLVSDNYNNSLYRYAIQPIDPARVFISEVPFTEAGYALVAEINFYSKYSAKEFFYAGSIHDCPVINPVAKNIRDSLGLSVISWPLIL